MRGVEYFLTKGGERESQAEKKRGGGGGGGKGRAAVESGRKQGGRGSVSGEWVSAWDSRRAGQSRAEEPR